MRQRRCATEDGHRTTRCSCGRRDVVGLVPSRRPPIVECDGVYLDRVEGGPGFALRGLTLAVEHWAFTPLLGPAGAGKTALLRVLAGLARPRTGRVTLHGVDLAAASAEEVREQVERVAGFVPSPASAGLLPELGIGNIELPLRLAGRRPLYIRNRVQTLTDQFGLGDLGRVPARELGPAETVRLAIATALAHEPDLLLLDEPMAGLTAVERDELLDTLLRIHENAGLTIVLATRDPLLAYRIGGVVRLAAGQARTEQVRLVAYSRGEGEHVEEVAVVDSDGRVEIPPDEREALGITRRARVTREDDHIGVWPEQPPPETGPIWRRR
ncbi:MAG: ATP-binding cassette domain-containing protein [Chloroflexi bacterium]|nr:ATP-binding cassette domain-containing protein [Chloroflexota bacterium]